MVEAIANTQFPTPAQGQQKREKRERREPREHRGARNQNRQNDGEQEPATLKFKISVKVNEAGKRNVVQMIDRCDFATLYAKAKQMCDENGVPEADCKLTYKQGRDKAVCQNDNDLELAIQASSGKKFPKVNFKIKQARNEEEAKERSGPGPRTQIKKLIAQDIEKQVEPILAELINAQPEPQPAQFAENGRKPKHIIKDHVKAFMQAFKNNSRAAASEAPLET